MQENKVKDTERRGDNTVSQSDRETNVNEEAAVPSKESAFLEKLSAELGIDSRNSEDIVKHIRRNKLKEAINKRAMEQSAEKRYVKLLEEAKILKTECKDFDLRAELENTEFKALIRCGFGLKKAYELAHHDELIEAARSVGETKGYEMAIKAIRDGEVRPEENGVRNRGGIATEKNVSSLSGGGIRDILRRVEKGAKIKF